MEGAGAAWGGVAARLAGVLGLAACFFLAAEAAAASAAALRVRLGVVDFAGVVRPALRPPDRARRGDVALFLEAEANLRLGVRERLALRRAGLALR